jgi:hypothetical protein
VWLASLDDPAGPVQTRIVDGGSGYVAQDQYNVHFGGVGTGRFTVRVAFPSTRAHPVRVDSLTTPALAELEPSQVGGLIVTVRRDSSCEIRAVPPPPLAVFDSRISPRESLRGYPNPARSTVRFRIDPIPPAGRLDIYDVQGRRVRSLAWSSGTMGGVPPGWDLRDGAGQPVANGVYLARLTAPGRAVATQRVLVLH